MATAAAKAVDVAFFQGAGPKGPLGLPGATIGSVDAVPSTLDPFLDTISKVEAAGATPTVIWMSPTTWTTLAKIKTGAGSNQPVLVPSTSPGSVPVRSIAGVPGVVWVGIPDTEAIVADASKIVVVMRRDGRVEVDKSVKFPQRRRSCSADHAPGLRGALPDRRRADQGHPLIGDRTSLSLTWSRPLGPERCAVALGDDQLPYASVAGGEKP